LYYITQKGLSFVDSPFWVVFISFLPIIIKKQRFHTIKPQNQMSDFGVFVFRTENNWLLIFQ